MESLHKLFSVLRARICACNERRSENTLRFSMTNRMLLLLYPLFIVCMAELNQDKYLSKLIIFIAEHPSIMLFNILIAGLIFLGALLLFRKGWLAMLLQSVLYMALSITELFKYNTNGNHLIMTDMKLFRSIKSLTSFAYIKITPRLIVYILIVLAFIGIFAAYQAIAANGNGTFLLAGMCTGDSSSDFVHTGLCIFWRGCLQSREYFYLE